MEQVPQTISRRKLALGGPAAIALAPFAPIAKLASIAPLGAAALLGGAHTSASAVASYSSDAFSKWYRNYFSPSANRITKVVLQDIYDTQRTQRGWPYYSVAQVETNVDIASDCINKLGGNIAVVRNQARIFIQNRPSGTSYSFVAQDLLDWRYHFLTLSDGTINYLRTLRQYVWKEIEIFLYLTLTDDELDSWRKRVAAIEVEDDRRRLSGTTYDSLEAPDGTATATDELVIKFGNKRVPVERYELVFSRTFIHAAMGFGPDYTYDSRVKHGIDTTKVEPAVVISKGTPSAATITSQAYIVNGTDDTSKGIDYYVDTDITNNGPFQNMTPDASRRFLRGAAGFVAHDTGLVYESYVVAQLACRAFAQLAIATTRQLIYGKSIDIGALQQWIKDKAAAEASVQAQAYATQKLLVASTGAIFACVAASAVMASIVMAETRRVVIANRGDGTTAADDSLQAKNRVLGILTGVQTAASLEALRFLNFAAFNPSESAPNRNTFIGGRFALADLTGGIADFVTVFRAHTGSTVSGTAQLLAGVFRITGGLYATADVVYKITNWKYVSFTKTVNPLLFTSVTAAVAAFFYTISAITY